MSIHSFNSEASARAMLHGLREHLRAALREQFEAAAKPLIDQAVAGAMETFEASLVAYTDPMKLGPTIEVLLRDRRTKE